MWRTWHFFFRIDYCAMKGAVPNERFCSSHRLCWSHLNDIWHVNCIHHVWNFRKRNHWNWVAFGPLTAHLIVTSDKQKMRFSGSLLTPHFKLLLKLPKTIDLMKDRRVTRSILFRVPVCAKLKSRGIIWRITFGGYTIVPVPCLNRGIHLGVQLKQKEIVHHRRKISYQRSSRCIIVQKPQNAAPKKVILPRVLGHQDWEDLCLGNYLPFARALPKVYKGLWNMVAKKQASLFPRVNQHSPMGHQIWIFLNRPVREQK